MIPAARRGRRIDRHHNRGRQRDAELSDYPFGAIGRPEREMRAGRMTHEQSGSTGFGVAGEINIAMTRPHRRFGLARYQREMIGRELCSCPQHVSARQRRIFGRQPIGLDQGSQGALLGWLGQPIVRGLTASCLVGSAAVGSSIFLVNHNAQSR